MSFITAEFGLRGVPLILALLVTGCGYVGDPLPPALNIPVPVADLNAVQRGDQIIIQFTVPQMTTEGLVLKKYGELDLRAGWAGVRPFNKPTWEDHASRIEIAGEVKPGPVRVTTPAAPWIGKDILIGVRLSSHKGRWSEWSHLLPLHIVPPVKTPAGVRVRAVPAGVRLEWSIDQALPKLRFRVFRRLADTKVTSLVGETDKLEWTDPGAEYGSTYEYRVQALFPAGDKAAESGLSEPVTITPEDRFPPTAPSGVRAVAGLDSIELTWNRSPEPDLAFYRVYRSGAGEEHKRIADSLQMPAFSDTDVVSGRRYRYSVTAVDRLGNESKPSATVEQVAP